MSYIAVNVTSSIPLLLLSSDALPLSLGCGGIRGVAEVLAAQQAEKIMVSKQLLDSLELVSARHRCWIRSR